GAQLPGTLWNHFGWTGCAVLVIATQAGTALLAGVAWREVRRCETGASRPWQPRSVGSGA
ncbi:MAG: hypothetical protein KGJ55_08230, partial [Gammaproteobacteria bacterium]|nr:hypothetical protein [Gammaproteobacteria bacterium]